LSILSIEDRLSALFNGISKERAAKLETVNELRDLEFEVRGDSYGKEKLGAAITWAEIYFSLRKSEKWGGRERVRDFLLDELYKARTWQPPGRQADGTAPRR
jgi:hypothetical protein